VLVEIVCATDELETGVVVVEGASNRFEPERALEPPMAEELGVEGRAQNRGDGIVEA
jgi:hypothetical protein